MNFLTKKINERLKPVSQFVTHAWYQPEVKPPMSLRFLSLFYWLASKNRHRSFLKKQYECYHAPVPVIVVGNITAGGTGKTPVVIALANYLQTQQFTVGIISRGYGGESRRWPVEVNKNTDTVLVGDEPVLITSHTHAPMFVGPNRKADIEALLKHYPDIDVIVADDGLQHYKLARDIEIAVIDGDRLFGNNKMMPAGPLREPISRLNAIDICVINGGESHLGSLKYDINSAYNMRLKTTTVYALNDKTQVKNINELRGKKMHAIAGIGNPQRFFNVLTDIGINIIPHAFDDHHKFKIEDLCFYHLDEQNALEGNASEKKSDKPKIKNKSRDNTPIIMTEKDAVKCAALGLDNCWVLAVEAKIEDAFFTKTKDLLTMAIGARQPAFA